MTKLDIYNFLTHVLRHLITSSSHEKYSWADFQAINIISAARKNFTSKMPDYYDF